jgi:uncharacterized protein YjdB/C1A family cysteine protease
MKRKLIAGLLAVMLALQTPAAVYATEGDAISFESVPSQQEETDSSEDEYVIPELNYHGEDDPVITSIEESTSKNATFSTERQTGSLDSSYVSPYVTSVKNQNPYGTCWAHAAVASAESSLIRKDLANTDIDLSEFQLAYFMSHAVTDPLGGTAGDSFTTVNNYLDAGGNQSLATLHLATWQGLVNESDAMYSDAEAESTLLDSYAYTKDVAHLENAYWISMKDQNLVKAAIMEYGSAAASYYSASAYYSTTNYWNTSEPVAEYCPSSQTTSTNHAITIVGWDDTYSKDNFGTYKPTSDGAWYCRNSWGSNWSKDGYFWISYEDGPLSSGTAYFYDFGAADNYDYNYQYDGCVTQAYYKAYYSKEANVFTATSDQLLKAVGFFTYDSQYQCNVKVYTNCSSNSPVGTLVAEQQADQLYAGYHTVVLDTPVSLSEGETFSVVVEQTTSSGGAPTLVFESAQNASWYTSTASAQAGQSYMSTSSGSWTDIGKSQGGNVRIKAYTVDAAETAPVLVTGIKLSQSNVDLEVGESITLSATVTPSDATNRAVNWSSNKTSVATVDSNGKVTAVAEGTAVITCTAADGSGVSESASLNVENPGIKVSSITLNEEQKTLEVDDTLELIATVLPDNADNKEVQWSSDDSAVASVTDEGVVTAHSVGTATITCRATDGSGVKAEAYVTVEASENDILVSRITLDSNSKEIQVGEKTSFLATVYPDNATNQMVVWSSSDSEVASVDAQGYIYGLVEGQATITCTAADDSGVSATATVTVTKELEVAEWPFKDVVVKEGNWKYESIKYVYEHGYMTGTSTDTFSPDQPLTRGMVVTVLYRMAGEPDVTYTGNYSDVKASKYYAKPVAWAAQEGIATGYKDGTFGAEKNISRQELAKMIRQFAKQQGYETEASADISKYVDYSKVSAYAVPHMSWAVATGIITGKNKSGKLYLDPQGEATRAECAAILKRYEDYYVNDVE